MLCAIPNAGNLSKLHHDVTPWLKTAIALLYLQNIILVLLYVLRGSLPPGIDSPATSSVSYTSCALPPSESLPMCPAFLFNFHAIPSGWCCSLWLNSFPPPCPPNTFQCIGLSSTVISFLESSLTFSKQIGCFPSYHSITCHRYLDYSIPFVL